MELKRLVWNYRVIQENNLWYLAEAYYEDGVFKGWCRAIDAEYDTREELVQDLQHMAQALGEDDIVL